MSNLFDEDEDDDETLEDILGDVMGVNRDLTDASTKPCGSDTALPRDASDTYYAKGGIAQLRLEPKI